MEKLIPNTNPFMPIPEALQPKQDKPAEFDKTNKVYNLIPKASKLVDADGVEQDVIVYEPTFVREYDLQEHIDSFAGEVGIQNILEKIRMTGDRSLLNQTGRESLVESGVEPIQDYSNAPSSKADAFNAVLKGVEAYDNLDPALKGKMSFAQVAALVQADDIDKYINSLIPNDEKGDNQ